MAASNPKPASTQTVNKSRESGIALRISDWRRLILPRSHSSGKKNPKAPAGMEINKPRPFKKLPCGATVATKNKSTPREIPAMRNAQNKVGSNLFGFPRQSQFLSGLLDGVLRRNTHSQFA